MAVEEAEAVAAAPAGAHKYDLTNTISEYLDLHLMFPLLDFVEISGMYPGQGVAQARLELLEPTNMVDYAMEVYQTLHDKPPPKEMVARRERVFARLEELKAAAARLVAIVEDPAALQRLIDNGHYDWEGIQEEYGLPDSALDAYAELAKFNYDCGEYKFAQQCLALSSAAKHQYQFAEVT
eukprot:8592-Heterococcus_DN1.PRE.3